MSRRSITSRGSKGNNYLTEIFSAEFILELNDDDFDVLFGDTGADSSASRISSRANLSPKNIIEQRFLNRWTKYAIVKISGPDEVSLNHCLSLLEQQFPVFLKSRKYFRKTKGIPKAERDAEFKEVLRSSSALAFYNNQNDQQVNDHLERSKSGKSALQFRRHSQPSILLDTKILTIFDSKKDKLSQKDIIGLLETLTKSSEILSGPTILPFENVTVRITFNYADNENKVVGHLVETCEAPISSEIRDGIPLIEKDDEGLTFMKVPKYETFTGKDQIPWRPIPERDRIPERTTRGLYDHEGKCVCNSDDGTNDDDGNDGLSDNDGQTDSQLNKNDDENPKLSYFKPKYINPLTTMTRRLEVRYSYDTEEDVRDDVNIVVTSSQVDEGAKGSSPEGKQSIVISESKKSTNRPSQQVLKISAEFRSYSD